MLRMSTARRRIMKDSVQKLRGAKEGFRDRNASSIVMRNASTEVGSSSSPTSVEEHDARRDPSPPPDQKLAHAMGLKEFMHRARVLGLYRGLLKQARELGDEFVADEARRQFRAGRDETDPLKIRMLVADATNYLDTLQGSSQGISATSVADNAGGSWLGIDDPDDKRGRVGVGFPWERSVQR